MMSISDMLDAAAQAIADDQLDSAGAWLSEVECHGQFTTGSERRSFFCLLEELAAKRKALLSEGGRQMACV